MKTRIMLGIILLMLVLSSAPGAHAQEPIDVNREVAFEQKLGDQIPLNLAFTDEQGNAITLADYFTTKPVILTLNYFHCPNLCSLELDQLTGTISDLSFHLGDEYDIVSVSIDPRETPDIAAQKKWQYIRNYARPGRGAGWHFLTGTQDSIQALANAVGVRYAYDAQNDEYAHPIGLIVLTPQGKIARYLYGVDYPPRDLQLALVEASQNKIGSFIDQVLLVCYHYDPANGRYSPLVLNITRIAGIATVIVIAIGLGVMWRKDLKHA